MKEIIPPQIMGELHVLDIPTDADIRHLLANAKTPENVQMLVYWMRLLDDKLRNMGADPTTVFEDTVILAALDFRWFCEDLERRKL